MRGKIRIDLIFVVGMSLIAIWTDAQQIKESNNMKRNMEESVYKVNRLEGKIRIDGVWDKEVWKNVPALEIANYMGNKPQFLPTTFAKLLYDDENIYGILMVEDRFVQCLVQETNGHVSGDSCVEFFFSPDNSNPLFYFNLEINCGGVPLLQFVTVPRKEYIFLKEREISKVEIAHSMQKMVFPEIKEDTVWTIEFKLPLKILEKYAAITQPKSGVKWTANFYKTASTTSNPHYLTWSKVDNSKPDFHLPQFFGTLVFK
ncbi:carbohydrate-binding family 9-like protein [Cognataquiflexum rubidum]|uniref:carbohydrate-binding family 9-like protein n=1 Tax=Cognataquiflexum rubidum TaxID=2922273 RepID=UPI001F1433FA|nr:carbohydrate-binding family 9-like protein [Cognataquiflexum rubidum]MCH6236684.1 carbohydrate-binding family 9-like protein [Cognataquiflexum rubidum]